MRSSSSSISPCEYPLRHQIAKIPKRRIRGTFHDFCPFRRSQFSLKTIQSPQFLLNGKTLKSNESRVAGKKLKDKRFPNIESRGYTLNELSGEKRPSSSPTATMPSATRSEGENPPSSKPRRRAAED
jgi:hypothetical protein